MNDNKDSAADALRKDAERDVMEALRHGINALPRYSFHFREGGGVIRVPDRYGAWIEWQAAHELFDAEVLFGLLAKMQARAAIDAAKGESNA